jgi:hypothetical protein
MADWGCFFWVATIAITLYFLIFPSKFPRFVAKKDTTTQTCRPYLNDDGSIRDDAPEVMAPSYDASTVSRGQPFPKINPDEIKTYRLIKSTIPIKGTSLISNYSKEYLKNKTPNEIHCELFVFNGSHHSHFCQWIHEGIKVEPNISGAYQYAVLYPAPYSDGNATDRFIGASDPYDSEAQADTVFRYGDHHILFLLHLDKDANTILVGKDKDGIPYFAADVYQQVQDDNHSQPLAKLPPNVLTCVDGKTEKSELQLGDVMEKSPDKKQEQLGWFVPIQSGLSDNWYSPACKPAINIYPQKDTIGQCKSAYTEWLFNVY